MAKSKEDQTFEILQQLLRVVSIGVTADKSITESIPLLKSAGIDNKTIATILGTTELTVRVIASQTKSKNRKIK